MICSHLSKKTQKLLSELQKGWRWGDDTEPGAPLCRASCAQCEPGCWCFISWKHSSPTSFIPLWGQGSAFPSPPCELVELYCRWAHRFAYLLSVGSIGRQLPHWQPARGGQSQQLSFSRMCSWAMPLEAPGHCSSGVHCQPCCTSQQRAVRPALPEKLFLQWQPCKAGPASC